MTVLNVDIDLIKKYDVPGPRYTSYPTAPHFREDIDEQVVLDHIAANNASARELSLYFHIPFCQTLCWYCGCTTVIGKNRARTTRYLDTLDQEMARKSRHLNPDREVVQLHFGGGTPTFLTPEELRRLGASIHRHFRFSNDIEAAVEIDPRRIGKDHIQALRDIGFNRASLGVQDNNPIVQKAINRIQPMELTEQTVRWLRETGFGSLNIDLIYGLPHQTVSSFEQTIDEVLALNPDRFAIYSYAHVPWIKPAQKILEKENLPSADAKLAMHKMIIEKLTGEGFVYIGMDHFARTDNELAIAQRTGRLQRNFQGYSTWGGADIYGFGMSSISQIGPLYLQNPREIDDYYDGVANHDFPIHKAFVLSDDDRIRRNLIMHLMCDARLDFEDLADDLGVDVRHYFASELADLGDLVADGLLDVDTDGITVTDKGRLLLRNIAMRFDAYLDRGPRRFSRTI
jgi:oxygen-independent coproporphyrinogen III oxidase